MKTTKPNQRPKNNSLSLETTKPPESEATPPSSGRRNGAGPPQENSKAQARYALRTVAQSTSVGATPWAEAARRSTEGVSPEPMPYGVLADHYFDGGSADWFADAHGRGVDYNDPWVVSDRFRRPRFIHEPPVPKPNGCGPEGQPQVVEDTGKAVLSPGQQEACNGHDRQYSELFGGGKAAADDQFCEDLRKDAEDDPYGWKTVTSANMCAAVKLFGHDAFEQAQASARESQDTAARLNGSESMFDPNSPLQAPAGQSEEQRRRNSIGGKAKLVATYAAKSLGKWAADNTNSMADGITSTTTDAVDWAADNAKAVGDGITSATTDATDWATDNVKAVGDTISSVIDEFEYHARSVMPVQVN
jgi:hypothetical protein